MVDHFQMAVVEVEVARVLLVQQAVQVHLVLVVLVVLELLLIQVGVQLLQAVKM
jgi:hypothetical protein